MTKKDKLLDSSDIPETTEDFWVGAQVNMPQNKRSITLRLDPDIIDWFRKEGKGYQTKINAVLRAYFEAHERR
jgi:uncharacterized protein (DUF4415 family)